MLVVIETDTDVGFKRISSRNGFQSLIKGKSNSVAKVLLFDIFYSIFFIAVYHTYFIRKFIQQRKVQN